MAPAGWPDKIGDGIFQGTSPCGFAEQLPPGLQGDEDGIKGADIPGEAISGSDGFFFKSAEQAVPDGELYREWGE